jgi:hypothetical protein
MSSQQVRIIAYIDGCRLPMAASLAVIPLHAVLRTRLAGASSGRVANEASGAAVMICNTGLSAAPARASSIAPTLDQLLAEPIVQQLMRRDRIDEATIRHLVQSGSASSWAIMDPSCPHCSR